MIVRLPAFKISGCFPVALALFLFPSLLFSQVKNPLIRKTGETIENVANKIIEPIRDPKALFSYWFDFNPDIETGKKTNFNFLPLFVSSPERGQGFGLKYAQASIWKKGDVARIDMIQTLKGKSAYRLKYEFPPNIISKMGGGIEAAYENYSRFYYGIGNETVKENESEYIPEFFEVRLPLLYGLTEKFSMGISLNFQNWKITGPDAKGILRQDLPNLSGGERSRFYTSSFIARLDNRDSKTNPSNGYFFEADYEYSKKLLGSETDFNRTTLESRHFFKLFGQTGHVFGVRLFLDYKNGDVPFYLLPELGGIFFNRGLIEGRFRDNLSIAGNWEYRFKIYQRLHWAFFVDAGNVYNGFNSIMMAHTKITGGTGMRYYVPPGNLLLARVDGGYSTEGLQIYLTFDHPF